jgi:hypothetical protein
MRRASFEVQSRFPLQSVCEISNTSLLPSKRISATIGARNHFSAFLSLENLQNQREFSKIFPLIALKKVVNL